MQLQCQDFWASHMADATESQEKGVKRNAVLPNYRASSSVVAERNDYVPLQEESASPDILDDSHNS